MEIQMQFDCIHSNGCVWQANRIIIYVAISILAIIMNANAVRFLVSLYLRVRDAFHVPSSCVWASVFCAKKLLAPACTGCYVFIHTHNVHCALCTFPTINSFTQSYDLYFIIHVCTLVLTTFTLSLCFSGILLIL